MGRRLLSSCDMWAPECVGSVVAARRLSCPAAYGIFVSPTRIEPTSPALGGGFLTTRPQGSPYGGYEPRRAIGWLGFWGGRSVHMSAAMGSWPLQPQDVLGWGSLAIWSVGQTLT